MNISSPAQIESAGAFLAQEQEIDKLLADNQRLRQTIFELQRQNEPLLETIDLIQRQLKERDFLMARLARDIREAVATYEKQLELLKSGDADEPKIKQENEIWDQW
jgi:hypothetical protein